MKKSEVLRRLEAAESFFAAGMEIISKLGEKFQDDDGAYDTFMYATDDMRDGVSAAEVYGTLCEEGLLKLFEGGDTPQYPSIKVEAQYPRIIEVRVPLADNGTLIAYTSESDYGTYQAGISYGDQDGVTLHEIAFAEIPRGELANTEGFDRNNDKIVVRTYEDETEEDFTRKTIFDPKKIPLE